MVANDAPSDEKQPDATDNVANAEAPKAVHKLPHSVRIDLNRIIKVKIISPERMLEVSPDSDVLDGLWHDRTETIYILKTLSSEDKWEIFRHEMIHAIHDIDRSIRFNIA